MKFGHLKAGDSERLLRNDPSPSRVADLWDEERSDRVYERWNT